MFGTVAWQRLDKKALDGFLQGPGSAWEELNVFYIYLLFLFFLLNKKHHRSGSTLKWSRNRHRFVFCEPEFCVTDPSREGQQFRDSLSMFQDRQDPGVSKK